MIPIPIQIPKEKYLLENYNLTHEKWLKIFEFQKGLCAICKRQLLKSINTDHHHASSIVRGLLCTQCNRALREWMTLEFVMATYEYLLHPPATAALGYTHYGLVGRLGTKKRRKLIAKNKLESKLKKESS